MLSKNKISEITALHQKKYRQSSGLFIAEGEKIVSELLASLWQVNELYATPELFEKYKGLFPNVVLTNNNLFAKISTLKSPAGILAVVKQQIYSLGSIDVTNRFTLCLDGIRDPGNLGTIIRIADWFGIKNIICSIDTVDVFNGKTIQASMGSFLRVNVIYSDLLAFLQEAKAQNIPVFGAVLNGDNLYQKTRSHQGVIVMGSESHGISGTVLDCINEPITIPSKLLLNPNDSFSAQTDSLNVAIATSIICAVFAAK
jgi:TrmH family RNA methyltransferase